MEMEMEMEMEKATGGEERMCKGEGDRGMREVV